MIFHICSLVGNVTIALNLLSPITQRLIFLDSYLKNYTSSFTANSSQTTNLSPKIPLPNPLICGSYLTNLASRSVTLI